MRKKLLLIVALTILIASTSVSCSGASADSSTLTILSITEGNVFVMKAGTDDWTEATVDMTLDVGDTIKTGDDSGAEITFFDGSTIELEAGTLIEITSLDSSPDTGTKTITLMQTIGTTISRVTKLLDPASTYAIETPSGVAAVRGSTLIVRIVSGDPNYPDGTVLITCVEGDIRVIWNGVEVQILDGYTCAIYDGLLELIPPNEPPQEEGGDATDEDTSNGEDEDQQPGSPATGNLTPPGMTPPPVIVYSDPPVIQTPPANGENPPPGGDETPPDGETTGTIKIKITSNPNGGAVYIWDATANDGQGDWFTEGTEETVPGGVSFDLTGDHHYYIWLEGQDTTYDPTLYPLDWTEASPDIAPDAQAVYGSGEDAKEIGNNPFHFGG